MGGTYYMFYEAYGRWITTFLEAVSPTTGERWPTRGAPLGALKDYAEGSFFGFVLAQWLPGTRPVYMGEVLVQGEFDRLVSLTPIPQAPYPLTTDARNDFYCETPAFHVFLDDGGGTRVPVYLHYDASNLDAFVSKNASEPGAAPLDAGGGTSPSHLLGYLATDLSSAEVAGSLLNRVCMAKSSDGVSWQRVTGAAYGGALLGPQQPWSTYPYDHGSNCDPMDDVEEGVIAAERWDVHRTFGAGYPVAIVRDDHLELYFIDSSVDPAGASTEGSCWSPPHNWVVRIPSQDIEDPSAYLGATRQFVGYRPRDVAWSPSLRRYVGVDVSDACASFDDPWGQRLVWSDSQAPLDGWSPPRFEGSWSDCLPLSPLGEEPRSTHGPSIARTELGHALEFATPLHLALHTYWASGPRDACGLDPADCTPILANGCDPTPQPNSLDHGLILAFPKDSDDDSIPDWNDPDSTIYVDASAPGPDSGSELDPYASLQDALDHPGVQEVRCAAGTYPLPSGPGAPARIDAPVVIVSDEGGLVRIIGS